MNNQVILITHLTQRTSMIEARKLLREKLPAEIFKKVIFLMDRKYRQHAGKKDNSNIKQEA